MKRIIKFIIFRLKKENMSIDSFDKYIDLHSPEDIELLNLFFKKLEKSNGLRLTREERRVLIRYVELIVLRSNRLEIDISRKLLSCIGLFKQSNRQLIKNLSLLSKEVELLLTTNESLKPTK